MAYEKIYEISCDTKISKKVEKMDCAPCMLFMLATILCEKVENLQYFSQNHRKY